ncbi:AAA family ATPase [Candidatus Micrarchaeota archaeon]|nr:AAA family ATPase [Candidatus Micrarchaeota archaeon]MBU1165329.1 AAA family ATPase [Candidatus Micrarchaeota archaeon]MBU1886979.1 AAA family ATPase [Candidatus Micrarchaeota archaeon]
MVDRKSNPTDAKTYYQMGNDYYEKGDYDKAIENYNMAILLNPVFSEAYFNRALSYYQLKNFDKSIADYTKSMELDPQNPIIYNNRGDAFYRKQDFQSAVKDYDRAISFNPNYLKAFYNRGLSYASIEEYEKAVEDFTKVIKLKADFAEAYHLRGLAYEYAGSISEAIVDYEKALELNPELTEAKTHLNSAKAKKDQGGKGGGEGGTSDIKMLTKPNMTFEDVAGMKKMKAEIREAVVYPMTNPDLARKYGKLGGGGILMYGPPGCGKTFIVKAAAGECHAGFINAKLSDLLDMYVGNTEKNIHKVFELARKNTPCILFFDEVDAIGGRRDQGEGQQYMKMAVNQMLYEIDGVEANNQNVLIIAATNAPWDVDPALRRSGRFSKTIFVPEPDYTSSVAILKMHAKRRPLAPLIPFWFLAFATSGYASADLKDIVDQAATIPWREAFMRIQKKAEELMTKGMTKEQAEELAKKQVKERTITLGDFTTAIDKKRSSLPPWYEQAKKQIGKQEEVTIIDGKEHKKVTDSKMGPGEKEAFKDLLDKINNRSQWYVKLILKIKKAFFIGILRVVVFITESGRMK